MSEQNFTNREITNMFKNIEEKLDTHIGASTEAHRAILEQVKYTNGRVRLLEKLLWLGMGGLAVLTFFFAQDRITLDKKSSDTKAQQAMIEEAINNVLFVNK